MQFGHHFFFNYDDSFAPNIMQICPKKVKEKIHFLPYYQKLVQIIGTNHKGDCTKMHKCLVGFIPPQISESVIYFLHIQNILTKDNNFKET